MLCSQKAPRARKNTDGGASPRDKRINKTKPRGGDRDLIMLLLNTLNVLPPFRGLVLLMRLSRGFHPPAVFFRTYGAYLADSNNNLK